MVEDVLNNTKIENLDTIIKEIATGVMRPVLDHMNGIVDYLDKVKLLKRHSDEDQRNIVRQDSIELTQNTERVVKGLTDVLDENPIDDPKEKKQIENIIDAAVKQVRKEYHDRKEASNSARIQTALEKSPNKFSASPYIEKTTTDDALHQARETIEIIKVKLKQVEKILSFLDEEIEEMGKKGQKTDELRRKRDDYLTFGNNIFSQYKIDISKLHVLEEKAVQLRGEMFERGGEMFERSKSVPTKKRLVLTDEIYGEAAGASTSSTLPPALGVEETESIYGDALSREVQEKKNKRARTRRGGRKRKKTKKRRKKKKTKRKKTRKKRRRKKKKRTRRKK